MQPQLWMPCRDKQNTQACAVDRCQLLPCVVTAFVTSTAGFRSFALRKHFALPHAFRLKILGVCCHTVRSQKMPRIKETWRLVNDDRDLHFDTRSQGMAHVLELLHSGGGLPLRYLGSITCGKQQQLCLAVDVPNCNGGAETFLLQTSLHVVAKSPGKLQSPMLAPRNRIMQKTKPRCIQWVIRARRTPM